MINIKLVICAPIICFLQFFVFVGELSSRACEEIGAWIYRA